jgi:hypothetical protein
VREFARATGAEPGEIGALTDRFTELATQVTGWRTLLRSGIVGSQQLVGEIDQRTAALRQLDTTVVSGLMQTAEYARAVLSMGPDPNADVAAGVAARLTRQEVLYRPGKTFHFVLMEAALRIAVADPPAMAVQLDRTGRMRWPSTVRRCGTGCTGWPQPPPTSTMAGTASSRPTRCSGPIRSPCR